MVVYVGESVDLHRRHHNDYRGPGGSHLKDCFEAALKARRPHCSPRPPRPRRARPSPAAGAANAQLPPSPATPRRAT